MRTIKRVNTVQDVVGKTPTVIEKSSNPFSEMSKAKLVAAAKKAGIPSKGKNRTELIEILTGSN